MHSSLSGCRARFQDHPRVAAPKCAFPPVGGWLCGSEARGYGGPAVFGPWGCCSKWPAWLQTANSFSRAAHQQSRCCRVVHLEASGESVACFSPPAFRWPLAVRSTPWLLDVPLRSLLRACLCPHSLCGRPCCGTQGHPQPVRPHFADRICKDRFPNKGMFWGPGWTWLCGGSSFLRAVFVMKRVTVSVVEEELGITVTRVCANV